MRLHLVTAPAAEPLSLAEAKLHLKVDSDTTDDTLISDLIAAAREVFEQETGRQVITATWELKLDRFPSGAVEIFKAPLLAVSAVTYVDTSGTSQTWDSGEYQVDAFAGPFARPGLLYPKADYTYPETRAIHDAVTVRFTAGYGAAADAVPESVRAVLKMILGGLYTHRESHITGTIISSIPLVDRLVTRYRVPVFV